MYPGLQAQINVPGWLMQLWSQVLSNEHSSTSWQDFSSVSNLNPFLQLQSKLPTVFLQKWLQPPFRVWHSSISLHVFPSTWRVNPVGQLQWTPVDVSLQVRSQPPLLTAHVSMSSRRFTRLSPSATDVALLSVPSKTVPSCSRQLLPSACNLYRGWQLHSGPSAVSSQEC